MLSQNKVFDEFINDWEKRVNKKEFGSKGFQVTTKKLTPELSKELPPIKEDKPRNKHNVGFKNKKILLNMPSNI